MTSCPGQGLHRSLVQEALARQLLTHWELVPSIRHPISTVVEGHRATQRRGVESDDQAVALRREPGMQQGGRPQGEDELRSSGRLNQRRVSHIGMEGVLRPQSVVCGVVVILQDLRTSRSGLLVCEPRIVQLMVDARRLQVHVVDHRRQRPQLRESTVHGNDLGRRHSLGAALACAGAGAVGGGGTAVGGGAAELEVGVAACLVGARAVEDMLQSIDLQIHQGDGQRHTLEHFFALNVDCNDRVHDLCRAR
mmetsp:Transcript_178104/g.570868  ORF Transcript_178104/g.570868 Transcript_178104/m.570868 type:complete len:251 (-) Transcript_178104:1058-1810(-)